MLTPQFIKYTILKVQAPQIQAWDLNEGILHVIAQAVVSLRFGGPAL